MARKTLKKLKFSNDEGSNDEKLIKNPFSYREGCIIVWRLSSEQNEFMERLKIFQAQKAKKNGENGTIAVQKNGKTKKKHLNSKWSRASVVFPRTKTKERALKILSPAAMRSMNTDADAPPPLPTS